jgi:hypothetical protein
MSDTFDFQVRRDNLRMTRWTTMTRRPLAAGEARLTVDRFAFSANNVTYAVIGDGARYWSFFPAPDGWGRVPVWGFADVAESRAEGLAVGQRIYGCLPMSSDLVVRPVQVGPADFVDATEHRADLPGLYNRYLRADAKAGFAPEMEGMHALLRPLFMTAFLIDDFLADNGFFGARTVMITSASSKTALALAFVLARRKSEVEVVGLTSAANEAFLRGLKTHDRVVLYDDITQLPLQPSVLVDVAGSLQVRQAVHEHLRDDLKYDCAVGRSHWEADGRPVDLPGPPKLFFAPTDLPGPQPKLFFVGDVVRRRTLDWGPGVLQARAAPVWQAFLADAARWLKLHEGRGRKAVEAAYHGVLEGRSSPKEGHVLSLT